jgi:hypothetical protein
MADLPEDWKDILIEYGKKGFSAPGIYTKVMLTKKVHERFIQTEPEYEEMFSYALDLAKSYWIDEMGAKLATDRNLNSAIYAIQVRNRFGWKQQDDQKPAAAKPEKEEPGEDLIIKHKKPLPEKVQTTN